MYYTRLEHRLSIAFPVTYRNLTRRPNWTLLSTFCKCLLISQNQRRILQVKININESLEENFFRRKTT